MDEGWIEGQFVVGRELGMHARPSGEFVTLAAGFAAEIVGRYHGSGAAQGARDEWFRIFSQREVPKDMPEVSVPAGEGGDAGVIAVLRAAGLVQSGGEARRMVGQGAVSVDGEKVRDLNAGLPVGGPYVVKVGKRRYASVTVA